MEVKITTEDLSKDRETVSASGMVLDELAYSAGEATQDELDQDFYATDSAVKYVHDNFDYENELLANTKTFEKYQSMCWLLKVPEQVNSNVSKHQKHIGAYIALTYPERFTELLEAYTAYLKENAYEYYDSATLSSIAPAFVKEIEDCVESNQQDQYREWLYGDHRDYAGVLRLIAEYYGAESLTYDEKTGDSVTFDFEEEQAREIVQGYEGYGSAQKVTVGNLKKILIHKIAASIDVKYAKKTAEATKRKAERERLQAYKAEQKAQAEAERKEKLSALLA